jgi:hypothetical protein
MKPPCNADVGHPCDVNDGKPCVECADYLEELEAAARWGWGALSPQEKDPAKYEREMKEAGRRP